MPSFMTDSKLRYRQDFLGRHLPSEFFPHPVGTGNVRMTQNQYLAVGGCAELYANGGAPGHCRFRLGELPDDSIYNYPHFSTLRRAKGETKIAVNTINDSFDLTVGFVGKDDPVNVAGAWLWSANSGWVLQVRQNNQQTLFVSNYHHPQSGFFTLGVETSPTFVKGYINGQQVCEITTNLYLGSMPWEYQIWNDGASSPVCWIDWLAIEQED